MPDAFDPLPLRPLHELKELALPTTLLGAEGSNRAPAAGLQISAANDLEALSHFLGEYDKSPGTYRIYQRECERLFLWAWLERGKPVSSLNRQDLEDFMNFLAHPAPAARWCGPKAPRDSKAWRPFVGPLSESAVLTATAALNSMLKYWVDAGYVMGNPMGLIRQRKHKLRATAEPGVVAQQPDEDAKVERFLDTEMWAAVTAAVEAMPRETAQQVAEYERLRFVCAFLYLLAPRAGELERQRMNSFREERGRWWWHVLGKGQKRAKVPVPDDMMDALVRYRKFLGLSAVPGKKDVTPLLCSVRTGKAITARRLNQVLKDLFMKASYLLPDSAAYKRDKLVQASAHWGRHTGITAKLQAGMSARYVQKDARHADARTTGRYIHEEDEQWHEEAQKQHLPWSKPI